MLSLKEKYQSEVKKSLKNEFKYKNVMQVPRLEKIVLNMGVGKAVHDRGVLDEANQHLAKIAGQKPVLTKSKKAIAGFKLRENIAIGCKVTLRGSRMFAFLERLIHISLPLVKDFRGVPAKFDGRGNYMLGWKDITVFPEINLDDVKNAMGLDICITTTANTDEECKSLLEHLGMPFRKN